MHRIPVLFTTAKLVVPGLLWFIACGEPTNNDQPGPENSEVAGAGGDMSEVASPSGGSNVIPDDSAAAGSAAVPPTGGAAPDLNTGGGAMMPPSPGDPDPAAGGMGGEGAGGAADMPEEPNNALKVLFDGTNLDSWVYDKHTSIVDGILSIEGCWCLAITKEDYDSFRIIVTSRVQQTNDFGNGHNGITFWGRRVEGDLSPRRSFMTVPLNCWTWDYVRNTSKAPGQSGSCDESGAGPFNEWNTTEIVADLSDGSIKSALNGKKHFDIKVDVEAGGWVKGPIGLQDHGNNLVEYKDIKVEANPVNKDLITLVP